MKYRMAATNRARREWAMLALVAYANATGTDRLENEPDFYDCISDLVVDLGHLAQEHGRSAGYTAFDVYRYGIGVFSAENRDLNSDPDLDKIEITVTRAMQRDVERERAKSKPRK
jgi:hypothetical protein